MLKAFLGKMDTRCFRWKRVGICYQIWHDCWNHWKNEKNTCNISKQPQRTIHKNFEKQTFGWCKKQTNRFAHFKSNNISSKPGGCHEKINGHEKINVYSSTLNNKSSILGAHDITDFVSVDSKYTLRFKSKSISMIRFNFALESLLFCTSLPPKEHDTFELLLELSIKSPIALQNAMASKCFKQEFTLFKRVTCRSLFVETLPEKTNPSFLW